MRLRHLFLLIYMTALSAAPCVDGRPVQNSTQVVISQGSDEAGHKHSSSWKDFCSPLCVCSCCAASIRIDGFAVTLPSEFSHNTLYPVPFQEKPIISPSYSIWQPPKLA